MRDSLVRSVRQKEDGVRDTSHTQEIVQLAFRMTAIAIEDGQHHALEISCEDLLEMTTYNLLHMSDSARKEQTRWLKKREKEKLVKATEKLVKGSGVYVKAGKQRLTSSKSQLVGASVLSLELKPLKANPPP